MDRRYEVACAGYITEANLSLSSRDCLSYTTAAFGAAMFEEIEGRFVGSNMRRFTDR